MNYKGLILTVFFSISSFAAIYAQDDLDLLIKGGVEDANYLAKGYVSPILKAFGNGLNQGWYNTAQPHKVGGVDLTLNVSAVYIPSADLLYHVDNTKLKNISLVSPANGNVPTVFGLETPTPTYRNNSSGSTFSGPGGIDPKGSYGINALPVPMAQLGIGLPKGFDLKVRYLPSLKLGDAGKLNMFGIGVMHDVKQYIPGIKNLPFDLSGFVGFTKMKLDVELDQSKPDQRAIFEASATTIQALISKKIAVLTVYGGLGYNIAKTNLALKGTYSFDNPAPAPPTVVKDPVNFDVSSSGPRASAGMRLKLAVFTFHADYTLQKYKTLTVGFGISVR
ncbi:MAG: hypothetical protein JJE09_09935 [Bacteroidia bacterium]|nr:hypothetical protein [Bacteroidia bacterium]